jgi:hypothetical protein
MVVLEGLLAFGGRDYAGEDFADAEEASLQVGGGGVGFAVLAE